MYTKPSKPTSNQPINHNFGQQHYKFASRSCYHGGCLLALNDAVNVENCECTVTIDRILLASAAVVIFALPDIEHFCY